LDGGVGGVDEEGAADGAEDVADPHGGGELLLRPLPMRLVP
jgi:hypothetical protein